MKAKWIVALAVSAALAAVAAVAICLSRGGRTAEAQAAVAAAPSAGDQRQGERGKADESAVDERLAAHRAEVEARRKEYEAFKKMSPEEQRQFRERKREELLARRRDSLGKKGPGKAKPGERQSAQAEREELRAAALKARAEYEETMGEATAANYRRRSVSYWMNRVKRQRERAAERESRRSSGVLETDAGASAADSQEQKTKGKTE